MQFKAQDLRLLHRNMVRGRRYDEGLVELFAKGSVAGMWHSGVGHEATQAGAATFLMTKDWLGITHRGITAGLSKGLDPRKWLAESMGLAAGYGGGKGRKCADREKRILPSGGTIGSCFPIATGAAIAAKRLGKGEVVLCLFGDGASQRGTLHECFNLAAVWKLPVVWVCENNLFTITTRIDNAMAARNVADLAAGYNMPGVSVDGQDVLAVAGAVAAAIERARIGEGPSLVECKTYRYREHGEGDIPTPYRTREEVERWKQRDPIELFRAYLTKNNVARQDELDAVDREIAAEVEDACKWVLRSPPQDPKEAFTHLYLEPA